VTTIIAYTMPRPASLKNKDYARTLVDVVPCSFVGCWKESPATRTVLVRIEKKGKQLHSIKTTTVNPTRQCVIISMYGQAWSRRQLQEDTFWHTELQRRSSGPTDQTHPWVKMTFTAESKRTSPILPRALLRKL
jgi:hypothetical protein